MAILLTGGAGYIGSHTCVELLNAGQEIVVLDNLSNSKIEALKRVSEITGKGLAFYHGDLLDKETVEKVFIQNPIEAVIHFAGFKAVGESVENPLAYYQNNISGSLVLFEIMKSFGVKNLVFSSSATVYGIPETVPITEDFPIGAINPYGRTKQMIEEILKDIFISDPEWSITLLRYFNPAGAHLSGKIGEDPKGIPNNLMPYIQQVAIGKLDELKVFGNDYPTPDGTGIRDYIHVMDLANGHVKALEKTIHRPSLNIYNLGTGTGYSVLELKNAFESATGQIIPYSITEKRPGDAAACFADPSKAQRELEWQALRGIEEMCRDSWNWQINNPEGYKETKLTAEVY
ncbi:UDP-glucose 4-epimerase GalE [Metabacillus sp. GX 13764]|uniref:UDP-glucose 4-epimerase GalE n=1 Tax=Metabacillus kandeliae TaxID=2900151 RepID=UPI001E417A45|nr:UDP-glucose 4-epimerase GalE [Metabacillus kandeliae]MCD7033144.1 UDP-glucose 4-epimerase GalE [Metabacillus kandeliae]